MKNRKIPSRIIAASAFIILTAGIIGLVPLIADADEWPERPITFVVGFGVAGSADRTARGLSTLMADEIGQPIKVVNKPGAGSQLASTYVLAQPADGYTIYATSISPYIALSIIHGGAKFKLNDFAYVNSQWNDWDIILVNKDRPYKNLIEFLQAVRNEPKKHSVSVIPNSSGHVHTLLLLDSVGIPRENLNIVTYESGGAARSAVAGGQVDITIQAGEGSEGIREFVRPLAVFREEKHPDWDGPPINEALKPLGATVPIMNGSMRGLAVRREFKEQHPDRWKKLVEAYRKTLEKKEVQKFFKESTIGAEWLGPEKTTEMVQRNYEIILKYKDLIK